MIIRQGESPRLQESRSVVLGQFEDAVDSEATIETPVQAGDRVIIYTDGLTESFNSRREMLGISGLEKIIREVSGVPLAEMKQQILNHVVAWRDGPAAGDVSLVVLELSWAY